MKNHQPTPREWRATTATNLINQMPSKVLNFRTPSQFLLQAFPHTKIISSLNPKVFGCLVFIHIQHWGKLDPTSLKCIFLGYSPHQKGYKWYSPINKNIYTSMDVTFFEHQAYYPKSDIQGATMRVSELEYTIWLCNSLKKQPTESCPKSFPYELSCLESLPYTSNLNPISPSTTSLSPISWPDSSFLRWRSL